MGILIKSCRKYMIFCIKRGEIRCFYFLVFDVLFVRDRECFDGLGGVDVFFLEGLFVFYCFWKWKGIVNEIIEDSENILKFIVRFYLTVFSVFLELRILFGVRFRKR